MKTVTLYTDGACSGNPGPGGWGAILEYNGVEKELSGGEDSTTNNRMELTAVIRGLQALKEPCTVELYSDSKYVIDALEKGWAWGWKKRGWIKSDKKPALGNAADPDPEARRALPLGQRPRGKPEEQPLRRAGGQRVEETEVRQQEANMFLSIGNDFAVRDRSIIGIFDLDNTSTSKRTREFLSRAEREGEVIPCDDLPKSFILTAEYGFSRVHLTALNAATLEKRLK